MNLRRWLRPGIGVKRWLAMVFLGELLLALALALLLRQIYREVDVDGPLQAAVYLATLQFLPYGLRGLLLAAAGVGLFALGSIRLVRAVTDPLRREPGDRALVEVIYQKRFLAPFSLNKHATIQPTTPPHANKHTPRQTGWRGARVASDGGWFRASGPSTGSTS